MVITSLNFGDPSLTSDIHGVVLNDEGISMSLTADWSYVDEDWYDYHYIMCISTIC